MRIRLYLAVLAGAAGCVSSGHFHSQAGHAGHAHSGALLAHLIEFAIDAAVESQSQQTDDADPPGEAIPDHLDHELVAAALDNLRPYLSMCAEGAQVTLAVSVRPGGDLEHLVIDAPAARIQECEAGLIRNARFMPTLRGGSFRYVIPSAPRPAGA